MNEDFADNILGAPLDLPRFEPDNWDDFWNIWHTDATKFVRVTADAQGNNSREPGWKGLVWDFNRPDTKDAFTMFSTTVKDYSSVFPGWRRSMEEHFPFTIRRISFLSNYHAIGPHRDGQVLTDHLPYAPAVRILLVDENSVPTFWLSKYRSQYASKFYIDLPPETNSFVYHNMKTYHAADYHGRQKILMMLIFDQIDEQAWRKLLIRSYQKWPQKSWIDDANPIKK